MALKKSDIQTPVLPKEAVPVDSLGGEVIVRGMLLKDRLALLSDSEMPVNEHPASLLAACVVDADGLPVFTQEEWEIYGAQHFDDALTLFNAVRRVSGLNTEVIEKN